MAREVLTPVTEEPEAGGKRGFLSFFKELPVLIGLALAIALIIKAFLIQAFFIPSESMKPTLHIGDRVLVNKLTYRFGEPGRGDVVVFKDPYREQRCPADPPEGFTPPADCNPSLATRGWQWFAELFGLPAGETKDYIKRIVALPGETLEMREGAVYVCTGCPEPAADERNRVVFTSTATKGPQPDSYTMPPFTVPEGSYYVLGDNRGNSSDSRVFKAIERDKIVGKAFVLLWPPNRLGGL